MANREKIKYVVIGNSAGGIGAVEAIREKDKSGTIAIISDEAYPVYSRPLISKYLAEKCSLERMLFRPADFYEKNNVKSLLGVRVKKLNPEEHTLELPDGQVIEWKKLLLATGGVPIVPPMEGGNLKGVFTFTALSDAKAIDSFLEKLSGEKAKAVVIGGGLIGVSVTGALVKRGVEVSIVEMKDRVLNVILDEEASALEEEALKGVGVEVIANHTVAKVTGDSSGSVASAVLDDGQELPCNLVVVAIGVRPRLELVEGTGIKVNRGILVDRSMATSNPDVYACGDVAEAYDFIYGENRLTPVWPNAHIGGRTAGFNMAGVSAEYPGGTAMNSSNYFGVDIVSAGIVVPPDGSYEVFSSRSNHSYRKIVVKDGLLAGMIFSGDIEKAGIVYNLMKKRVSVEAFKEELVAEDFGLLSMPEEVWRPLFKAPPSVSVASIISSEEPEPVLAGE